LRLATDPHVGKLELGHGVADRTGLVRGYLFDQRELRTDALDGDTNLLGISL
jgi:hypothetical protein